MRPICYPEDRLPPARLLPMGLQHVIAMFGATVLAPIIMGFSPQVALLFSGVGTLIFLVATQFKVPSYLGSSFSFIGPVLAVTGGDAKRIPQALCGIAAAAALYGIAAAITIRKGSAWVDWLMPPVVTGSVVALIGLNLAVSVVVNATNTQMRIETSTDAMRVAAACATFLTSAAVAVYARGFLRLLPILIGVLVGYGVSSVLGLLDAKGLAQVREASWIGLPPFQGPSFSWPAILMIAPVFVVLVAENKGHLAAIGAYMGRDLSPQLGRAYLGDAVATFVSAMGGGTPQTTYAENMGVMALTRVFSTQIFAVAAGVAILLGLSPKFGAVIQTIPAPVLAGATLVLYGLIAMMGVRIWIDEKVDFSDQRNLLIAGTSVIAATGFGINGVTVGGVNVAGIAFGTVLAVVLRLAFGSRGG